MNRLTFLPLALIALVCWLSTPNRAHAQVVFGLGLGGEARGGYPFGGPGGGVGAWGWGGWGYGGYGYGYVPNVRRSYYGYASPGYYTQNYSAPSTYVEPIHISTAGPTGGPGPSHGTHPEVAHVYVDLPASAQLFFDDTLMHEQGSRRVFRTPPLQPNDNGYPYELTARWTEDGKEQRVKRVIRVMPGGTTHVNFLAGDSNSTPASTQSAPVPPTGAAAPPRATDDGK